MTGHDKSEHWIARWISAGTHHLPAALMVAAVVFICHHKLHLLDAIDGYAYLGIGNRTANSIAREIGSKPTVAVVLIDQKSHEDYYQERSPLNRCQLKKDLEAIYDLPGPPKLLVIDLDLSPPLPLLPLEGPENQELKYCDAQLKTLLSQQRKTETVVIAPFEMLDKNAQAKNENWRKELTGIVTFADPSIRVSYGLVNGIECTADSLAVTAYDKYPDKPANLKNCRTEEDDDLKISPGQYFSGLRPVSICQLSSRVEESQCHTSENEGPNNLPVVFFGASFGDSDTYLTPLGTMYGVEVHAAAFMSLLQPTTHNDLSAFILDVVLGLVMGSSIAFFWHHYFSLRFSSSAVKRQWAPWMILLLVIFLLPLVAGLTYLSFVLLRHCNIWLSPIPIAVGMLIESFFNSAIGNAVKEGYEQRQALIRRLQASGPDSYASRLALEAEQHPHPAHSLQERAKRFVYLDCLRLWRLEKYGAALLLFVRRLMFLLVLLLAFYWDSIVPPIKDFLLKAVIFLFY
ncbi:CHASE2 domain-containing protein [Pseudomonas sp. MAG733B]|uniref:CHASE2 domain-containing protein n=1 Tax=Pseudomonas sp. MAG733B TaxID=3122079 RepID=UPI0030D33D2F